MSTTGAPCSIAKIIHQIWIDDSRDGNSPPPSKYHKHIQSLKAKNPDWSYKFWNQGLILKLFEDTRVSRFRALYTRLRRPIMRADVARLVVLYLQGGLYLDLDFICYRPLSDMLQRFGNSLLLVQLQDCSLTQGSISNAFLASEIHHPIWLHYLEEIDKRVRDGYAFDILNITGPSVLYSVAVKRLENLQDHLVPSEYIFPYNGDRTPVPEMKEKLDRISRAISEGQTPEESYRIHDGPFLASYWWDGTGWATEIWYNILDLFISGYGSVVLGLVLVVLLLQIRR